MVCERNVAQFSFLFHIYNTYILDINCHFSCLYAQNFIALIDYSRRRQDRNLIGFNVVYTRAYTRIFQAKKKIQKKRDLCMQITCSNQQ